MKIGYPCINHSIGRKSLSTFRLGSFTNERLIQSIEYNLDALTEIIFYNLKHNIKFFRISSDIIPFASHPVCKLDWKQLFKDRFLEIGRILNENKVRISMHPDQFVLINARDNKIVVNSIRELEYHADLLDLLGLDSSAKIQIHIGGVYGDKERSINDFIVNFDRLISDAVKKRLVIENDDFRYDIVDCIRISKLTKIPVLLDIFHHECYNTQDLSMLDAMKIAVKSWNIPIDGIPMIDYSSQEPLERKGKHASTINLGHFKRFIKLFSNYDYDMMLEIKDKENSATRVIKLLEETI